MKDLVIDQYETPVEWGRMCLSNSLILAAYVLSKGEPWHLYLSHEELEWFYACATRKYHTMSNFRKASTDHKIMYLLSLARFVRNGDSGGIQ